METKTRVYEGDSFCYVPIPKKECKDLIGKRVVVKLRALARAKYAQEKDDFVKYMFKTKTFEGLDTLVLRRLYLGGAINKTLAMPKSAFSDDEIKEINRLERHPLELVKKRDNHYYLSEEGLTASLGYVKGLLRAKEIGLA